MNATTVSLIVAVFERADFLELVLQSVERQTYRDLEVVIAEDGESETVNALILARKNDFPFTIRHVRHEDRGFRKNRILNEALKASSGDYIVFIDGDCLLHKRFIEQHVKCSNPCQLLFGRRVMLGEKTTKKLLSKNQYKTPPFWKLMLDTTRHLEEALYIPWLSSSRKTGVKGSNFSLSRELIFTINGFDEDFEKPYGGEDTDIERRLRIIGASIVCTKYKTIQYHMFHGGRDGRDDDWKEAGYQFFRKKVEAREWFCRNGLVKTTRPIRALPLGYLRSDRSLATLTSKHADIEEKNRANHG